MCDNTCSSYQPAPASSYVQQELEYEDWPVGPGVYVIFFFLLSLMLQDNKLECLTVPSHFRITQYFLNNYSSLPISWVIVRCTELTQKVLYSLFKNRNTVAYFSAKSVKKVLYSRQKQNSRSRVRQVLQCQRLQVLIPFALATCPVKLFYGHN